MNIAIIEDSADDQKKLADYLRTYFSLHITAVPYVLHFYPSGEEFLQDFDKFSYELIFIDYYLKALSGLETAKIIRQTDKHAPVFFTTFSRDYAIECYKVKACGYLVKPFCYEEFAELMELNEIAYLKKPQLIEVFSGLEKVKLLTEDIIYCDVAGHYTLVHTKQNAVKKIRMPLTDFARFLSPFREFLDSYRGCLVNMDYISRIEDYNILLQNGERIPFRKKERAKITAAYSEYMFNKVRNKHL